MQINIILRYRWAVFVASYILGHLFCVKAQLSSLLAGHDCTWYEYGMLLLIGAVYGVSVGPWGFPGTRFPGNLRPVFPVSRESEKVGYLFIYNWDPNIWSILLSDTTYQEVWKQVFLQPFFTWSTR